MIRNQPLDVNRKEFIEENLDVLIKANMKVTNYSGSIFWSMELENRSTITLNQAEFDYYMQLKNDRIGKMREKNRVFVSKVKKDKD